MIEEACRDFEARVRAAHRRIASGIGPTPLEFSDPLSELTGARIFLKWECDQLTGSFKMRGALNKLRTLSPGDRARGVVSASTGNHGLAMARASRLEGVDLKLFLPATVSDVKKAKLAAMGVETELFGAACDKTEAHAREFAAAAERVFVSPYNDWEIIFGAGTVGLEIARDLPDADDVLVPVGGGGLISGIAGFLRTARPLARTIGVEPEASAFMAASLEAGRLVEIEERETIADAVAGGIEPGAVTFPVCRDFVDRILTVSEALIGRAMALLFDLHGKAVEGSGALPLAALLDSPDAFRGRTVALVISGGNIAAERFRQVTGRDVS